MSDRPPAPAVRPGRLTESQLRLLGRLLDAPTPRTPEIARGRVDRARAPLSSAQQRIWFFDQLRPDSALYNITGVARLTGALDADALQRALDTVVLRHEILRTTYHADGDGEPWSRVEVPSSAIMTTVDLTQLPEAEREAAIAAAHRAEASRPFDLTRDQMLRTLLLRTAPDEHLLHLSLHHIAADGWSLGVLIGELGALYPALAEGRPAALPELPVQYADFAGWQRERLDGAELRSQLRDWVDRLMDAPPLDLPTDRPRRQADGFAGATTPLELGADLVDRIKRYADARHATPYMVLVAALSAVLSRWSGGQRDIVLGCAVAGRNRSQIEPLIGFFVNTVALRLDLGGAPAMDDLLDAARTACHDAYARQDVPFERVIEELHPERDPAARVPLVRHMLVLHNSPRPRLRLPGLDITTLPVRTDTSKFELQLELAPTSDGGLDGWIEYATDLFDESTVSRIGQGLLLLLDDALERPDVPVTRLRLLTDEDRRRVVEQWSGAPVPAAGGGTLHALVEQTADASPDAVAIIHGDSVLTYRDLEERANRLANRLRALGARRHDAIGICLPRSADAIVAMLAVLKSGAAYLPLDPSHPATRNARLALDAAAPVVITGSAATALELATECGPATRILDVADESVTNDPPDRPAADVRPDDSAYIIFTSGSTGAPKGAINEHAAVANRILWMQQAYRLEPGEPVLHKTPLGFDVAGWEWLWPLAVGARIVVADADGHRDPAYIASLITRHAVTTCHFVPSMLRAFVTEPAAAACAGVLRRIICSGEELPPALAREASEALPGARLHNLYGPTEAAIDVTAWPVPDGTATGHLDRLPIGHPIAGARLYVLDQDMQPVPPGVPGELLIGGVATGRGYLNRPALTAERFVPDPFAPDQFHTGRRLYRTGDRVRWLPDSALDFLGRQDDQIKIRGQRIEPGEVAAALADHPDVDRAVVVPFHDEVRGVQLAGYVTLRPRSDAASETVSTIDLVDGWRTVFDETYRAATPADPTFDIAGWVDSGTGEPIPDHEMRAWVEETVERITVLEPRRVLEIGCGTGLLLTRIAPHCQRYHGTDISASVLDRVRGAVEAWDTTGVVSLEQRPAHDFSGWGPGSFDTVVINSVAQYLPGVEQLVDVLCGALSVLSPGGRIFVGDVRSLPMLEALHCSILLDRLPPNTALASLRRLVAQRVAGEEELAVHPALFEAVAGPGTATVLAKASQYRNELTKFRYDVVITAPALAPAAAPAVRDTRDTRDAWEEWSGTADIPPAEHGSHGWRAAPDARVSMDLAAVRLMRERADGTGPRTVAELRQALAQEQDSSSTEPAALAESATAAGYRLLPHLGAVPGTLDLELRAPGTDPLARPALPRPEGDGWTAYANDPAHAVRLRRAAAALRAHAAATLPEHMVPASLVVLAEWPVGANGKLDRSALPVPDARRAAATGYVAPRTPTERAVAAVWREALGLDRIGVHDDFFGLGGHSLLAIQVVGRLREITGRDLPLAVLLSSPTVEAVSGLLDTAPAEAQASAPIARAPRRRRVEAD